MYFDVQFKSEEVADTATRDRLFLIIPSLWNINIIFPADAAQS